MKREYTSIYAFFSACNLVHVTFKYTWVEVNQLYSRVTIWEVKMLYSILLRILGHAFSSIVW